MKPLLLPLLLLFIVISCQELDEPNVDLRVFYSVGECRLPLSQYQSISTLYTGYLVVIDVSPVRGTYYPNPKPLRVYKGILKMTLEPAEYQLQLRLDGSTSFSFEITDSVSIEGDIYLRSCVMD